jgi:hypothetical protein
LDSHAGTLARRLSGLEVIGIIRKCRNVRGFLVWIEKSQMSDDLVRVDGTGTAHPVGKAASQKMRARQGGFRLMPAPPHVVLMRKADDQGRAIPTDGSLRLCGEITTASVLCDVFAMVGQSRWGGELSVYDGGANRSVFFENGTVIGASSNAEGERLGEVFYRYGALTKEQIALVMKAVTVDTRFGEAAVRMALITREKLFQLIAKQVEEVVYATLRTESGMFYFLDRFEESRLTSRQNMTVNSLIMEGVRRMDEMKYFRERIPSDKHVPERVKGRPAPTGEELSKVFAAIDGARSIADICRVVGQGEFDVTRHVFQMLQEGCVVVRPPRPTGPAAIVTLFNEAMSLVMREVDAVGKGDEVRKHLASFATGAGIYDTLFMRAGPKQDGTLDEQKLIDNAAMLAGPDQAEGMLAQWLHDYVSFAIFIADPVLRASAKSSAHGPAFAKDVAEIVAPLAQKR